MSAHVIPEVATIQEVHDQINVLSVLEGIPHVDDEPDIKGLRVVELGEDVALIHHALHRALHDDPGL